MSQFGAPHEIIAQPRTLGANEFLFFGTPPARVDVLRCIPGTSDFDGALKRATYVDMSNILIPVMELDDLRQAKRAAGRPRDLRDLAALNRLRR